VLKGLLPTFTLEYGGGEAVARWFTISVVPLTGPEGGAVVAHAETTEIKRAEIEAQRVRQELAHSPASPRLVSSLRRWRTSSISR